MLRAEPKTLTAGGRSARVSKPSTNSLRMRSARHASLVFHSVRKWESSSFSSAVLGEIESAGLVENAERRGEQLREVIHGLGSPLVS